MFFAANTYQKINENVVFDKKKDRVQIHDPFYLFCFYKTAVRCLAT